MNFQGIKATVPPRIFIQMGIRLGQESQFNSKNYFLGIAKPWPCPMAIHLPKDPIPVCSPASRPLPCPPRRSQNLPTQHGRVGRATGAQLLHSQVGHGLQPRRLRHCPGASEVTASSSIRSEPS